MTKVKPLNKYPKLTKKEAEAILSIKGGADVYDYALAGILRGIQRRGLYVNQLQGAGSKTAEKKHYKMALFSITDPMMYKGTGVERMPFFGAIATKHGLAVAKAIA